MIDQATGESLLVWTIRLSLACYLARLFVVARHGWTARIPLKGECVFWTIGCAFYLVHVACAFAFAHDWSHANAIEHTAIETQRITGVRRGEGLWVNYLFTLVWFADTARIGIAHLRQRPTNRKTDIAVHAFFGFIFFNATVVFGPSGYRWAAVVVVAIYAALVMQRKVELY